MRKWIRFALAAVISTMLVASVIAGCSKDKTTNPPPGGGGGGGNLELNSGDLGQNAGYDHTFAAAGSFAYHCERHPTMHGSVTVQAGSPTSADVMIMSFAFTPANALVAPGGTVHWINHDAAAHTVTSDTPNP
jgi:plastocyanin